MRIKLTIAYDGQAFSGWQSQSNDQSIQDHLETALFEVTKEKIRLHGSGRTDAGVHAEGQTAHFDPPQNLTLGESNWVPSLNTKLPPQIRIIKAQAVKADFHARFDALTKTYRYEIISSPILYPQKYGFVWHHPRPFSWPLLQESLQSIIGRHHFEAFSAKRGDESPETDYFRSISTVTFQENKEHLAIRITGNGFLYKMVRILVGTAMKVATGQLDCTQFQAALKGKPSLWQPYCAPPNGLTLEKVNYG